MTLPRITTLTPVTSAKHVQLDAPLAPQLLSAIPVQLHMLSIPLETPVCYVISLLGNIWLPVEFVLPAIVPVRPVMVLLPIA